MAAVADFLDRGGLATNGSRRLDAGVTFLGDSEARTRASCSC